MVGKTQTGFVLLWNSGSRRIGSHSSNNQPNMSLVSTRMKCFEGQSHNVMGVSLRANSAFLGLGTNSLESHTCC